VTARVGLGIVGLGTAGAAMLAAALSHDKVRLVALADPLACELPLSDLGDVAVYDRIEALLEDKKVEVVYVATPTPLHSAHVSLAVAATRHVIVEKPVTAQRSEVDALATAAASAGVVVLVGHSESFEPYVAALGAAIASGRLGEVVALSAEKLTDWMRRPRRADELDPAAGGGIVRRQGVHQIDVVRSLVPEETFEVRRARLHTDLVLGVPCGYLAWLEAAQATALLIQDGTRARGGLGHVAVPPGEGGGRPPQDEKRRRARELLERAIAKEPLSLGEGDVERVAVLGSAGRAEGSSRRVVLEHNGVLEEIDLSPFPEGRHAVLDELCRALLGARPRHDLAWGGENLRLCEAIEQVGSS
jgi:phthalate 4,5-cis-dihydrodiol dehydrogenase